MALPGCTWLHLALPGCTWLNKAVLGCTMLDLALLGCAWLYQALLGCTWLYLAVPGYTWLYLAVQCTWSGLVKSCLAWPCLVGTEGFKDVWNTQTYMSMDGMGLGYLQTDPFLDHLAVIIN